MGILNVTPDSFSDGGKLASPTQIKKVATQMLKDGAKILDIGAEASGPNSVDVSVEEELKRIIPALKAILPIAKKYGAQISIDTYKSKVADMCLSLGANIINDITGCRGDKNMPRVIKKHNAKIVIMYSKDPTPRTTRTRKKYKDVIATISNFFEERLASLAASGVPRRNIILDPGMGAFVSGDPKYSFEILHRLSELKKFKLPILVGTSMKSMHPFPLEERRIPSVITALLAYQNGADILRVHHVKDHDLAFKTLAQ